MKIKYVLGVSGIAGAMIPIAFFAASRLHLYFFGSTFDLLLWPSSILLMSERETPQSIISYPLILSVFANVVYYVAIGMVVWTAAYFVRRLFRGSGRPKRDT